VFTARYGLCFIVNRHVSCTTLTDWFYITEVGVFTARYGLCFYSKQTCFVYNINRLVLYN